MVDQLQQQVGCGEKVFLTGAGGFVGCHVLHALLAAGYQVRALLRSEAGLLPPLEGCTVVRGDLLRPGDLRRSMLGCRYLIHVAALYSFAPVQRDRMFLTNVYGCTGLLEAAYQAGIERAVVTSSSSTVGPARGGRPATEEDWDTEDGASAYHRSKLWQARAALAARLPVVLVLPTMPVGPGDWKPTPTGKMIVDFLRGRIFATLGGGLNVVAVEDVARAHVLALQRGRPRERYLIGGEDMTLARLWEHLARICGRSAPTLRIPWSLAMTLGMVDDLRCRFLPRGVEGLRAPLIPLEGVRMARHQMYASSARARAELGYAPTPVVEALERAVRWYRENGYARE